MERLEIHGPTSEVMKLKDSACTESMAIEYYESADRSKKIDEVKQVCANNVPGEQAVQSQSS